MSSTEIIQRLEDRTRNIRYSLYDEDKEKYVIECVSGGLNLKVEFYKDLLKRDNYIVFMTKYIISSMGTKLFYKGEKNE